MNKISKLHKKRSYWLSGKHSVLSALKNKNRKVLKIYLSKNKKKEYLCLLNKIIENADKKNNIIMVEEDFFKKKFNSNYKHQGIAILSEKIREKTFKDFLDDTKYSENLVSVFSYKIQDPRNLGAIIRSAVAFNIKKIFLSKNNSTSDSQVMSKVSSGGVDEIEFYNMDNLNSSLKTLRKKDWLIVGLDATAKDNVNDIGRFLNKKKKVLLILGSENKGLNINIKNNCSIILKIPISLKMESLNVSCAASIAFYELKKHI